jgi:hypothetical protein
MASFQPLPSNDAHFSWTTERFLNPQATDQENFLTPRLKLEVQESATVSLPAERASPGLIIAPTPSVTSVPAGIAKVELQSGPSLFSDSVFKVTGISKGIARLEALFFSSSFALARLNVIVLEKPKVVAEQNQVQPNINLSAAVSDFFAGLKEGLSPHTSEAARRVKEKLLVATAIPGSELILGTKFQMGVFTGLQEGGKAFLDMLKGVKQVVFDSKFRDEVMQKAAELIGPWTEVLMMIQGNPTKFAAPLVANAKAIGRALGDEIGKEVTEQTANKSAGELCEWAGRLVGLVLFEVIMQIATDLIGIGVVQGAKWVGEGASMIGRLLPRLKPLFTALEEVKTALRAKLGKLVRVADEVGGMTGSKWARRFSAFWRTGEATPRAFSAAEVEAWTAKTAARMKQLGIPERYIGVRGIPDESGRAFTATGRMRGGNVRGQGISVHGSVENSWPNFPEWNKAGIDARIDAVIAHEWMEFNDLTHFETVELATESKLPISSEAKTLLEVMQKKGLGPGHLLNEP